MNDLIMIKSGALGERSTMPKLSEDELGYRTDEKALYIGTGDENERLCGVGDIPEINAKIDEINELIKDITTRLAALENPSE